MRGLANPVNRARLNPKTAATKKTLKSVKKPDTKILTFTDNANYIDIPEVKDS